MKQTRLILAGLALTLAAPVTATNDDLRSVVGMQHHNRVLIVFTPSLADGRLTSQRAIMAQLALQAASRDLLFVQVDPKNVIGAHDNGEKLRRHFHVATDAYHALLIDKDGRILREAGGPLDGDAMLQAIDHPPPPGVQTAQAAANHPADSPAR